MFVLCKHEPIAINRIHEITLDYCMLVKYNFSILSVSLCRLGFSTKFIFCLFVCLSGIEFWQFRRMLRNSYDDFPFAFKIQSIGKYECYFHIVLYQSSFHKIYFMVWITIFPLSCQSSILISKAQKISITFFFLSVNVKRCCQFVNDFSTK